jgi:WD40 repeat protein
VDGALVPVRERVVAVTADLGESRRKRWCYASGLLIGGRQVLTAAHVVQGAKAVSVRRPRDQAPRRADLEAALIGEPDGFDLAILDVPEGELLGPVPVALVNRDVSRGEYVEGWAVGYPEFQELARDARGRSIRETAEVEGEIPPLSNLRERLLSLQVNIRPEGKHPPLPRTGRLDESDWAGMSGAAVFTSDLLLGVITEHSRSRGASDLTVLPLDWLLESEKAPRNPTEWWERLGVGSPDHLLSVPTRSEPAYHATLRVIRQQTLELLDRDADLSRIKAFATGAGNVFGSGSESAGYAWLVAQPWAGKTALLAEAVQSLPDDVDPVAYFLSELRADASREAFLAAVVPQLAWLLHAAVPSAVDVAVFWDLWARAAARAQAYGRYLLLVVDGLDEDLRPSGASVAAALPTESLSEHARVLVSSRPHRRLAGDLPANHPLRSITPVPLDVSPHATEVQIQAEQELHALLTRDIAGSAVAYDVIGLLCAASGPLSVYDLADMMNNEVRPRDVRAFVSGLAGRSLRWEDDDSRFTFGHPTMLETCREDPDVGGDPDYWDRLRAWADKWRSKRWPVSDEVTVDTPRYLLDSYPTALRSHREEVATIVGDVGWLDTAVFRIGVDRVLATLREAAQNATTDRGVAAVLRLLQIQAHHLRSTQDALCPGRTATQLAWEGLRRGGDEIAGEATESLLARTGPQLVPAWTTEQTGPHLIWTIGWHSTRVSAMAVLDEGRALSSSDDRTLILWDLSVPGHGHEFGRGAESISALVATGDGKAVSGGDDGRVMLWDPDLRGDTGRELGRHDGRVFALAATPHGEVVSGDGDGRVMLWRPDLPGDTGRELARHDSSVSALAATKQGKVVSGGYDGMVRLSDPGVPNDTGRELCHHKDGVAGLVATKQGKVISGGGDGRVMLLDPDDPDDAGRELVRHSTYVTALVATAVGKVVFGGGDGRLVLVDPCDSGDSDRELGRHDGPVVALGIAANNKVVSAGDDGAVRLWDVDADEDPRWGLGHQPLAVVVTPDGNVISGDSDGFVRLWYPDIAWEPDWGDPAVWIGTHDGPVNALAITPDGKVVSGGADGVVRLCDPEAAWSPGRELGRIDGYMFAVAVTPAGQVVSAGFELASPDMGVVRLWDPSVADDRGRVLGVHPPAVRALAVTPEGNVISGGVDGVVRLWNPNVAEDQGRELGHHDEGVSALAITPDGKVVSGGSLDGMVRLWNPDDLDDPGRELGRHQLSTRAIPVFLGGEVSSAGRRQRGVSTLAVTVAGNVISAGYDGVVRMWDPNIPEDPGRALGSHDRPVESLATNNGGRIALATHDGLTAFELTPG